MCHHEYRSRNDAEHLCSDSFSLRANAKDLRSQFQNIYRNHVFSLSFSSSTWGAYYRRFVSRVVGRLLNIRHQKKCEKKGEAMVNHRFRWNDKHGNQLDTVIQKKRKEKWKESCEQGVMYFAVEYLFANSFEDAFKAPLLFLILWLYVLDLGTVSPWRPVHF